MRVRLSVAAARRLRGWSPKHGKIIPDSAENVTRAGKCRMPCAVFARRSAPKESRRSVPSDPRKTGSPFPLLGAVGSRGRHAPAQGGACPAASVVPAAALRRPAPWRGAGAGRPQGCGHRDRYGACSGSQQPGRTAAPERHAPCAPHPEPARGREHGQGLFAFRPGLHPQELLCRGPAAGAGQGHGGAARHPLRPRAGASGTAWGWPTGG